MLTPILFVFTLGLVIREVIGTIKHQRGFYVSDVLVIICLVTGLLNSFEWEVVQNG